VCVAPVFGAISSAGSFMFSTTTAAALAATPQSRGLMLGGGQAVTSGFTFGVGTQSQTTSAALPGFSLPTTATASTGQPRGFQFAPSQSSSVAAPGFGLLTSSAATATSSATGFSFGAASSTSTGLPGLLGTGTQPSLFSGVKPGLL